jgi:c-di-AMP phosphodiesterase-like protein
MTTLKLDVLSGDKLISYTLTDVIEHWASEIGYYFIKTKTNNWYFPINFTILQTQNGTKSNNNG